MHDGQPLKTRTWTPERETELKRLLAERLDYSIIARRMGLSDSVIHSKATRMGLLHPQHSRYGNNKTKRYPQEAINAELRQLPLPDDVPAPRGTKTLMELGKFGHECRNPYGSRPPYLFCGQPTTDGHAYCSECEKINLLPLRPSPFRPRGFVGWPR